MTILGPAQARSGYLFLFKGIPTLCLACEYKKACLDNLDKERIYTVTKITAKKLQCILRNSKGILVEVEEADIDILIRAEIAIPSAVLTYEPVQCPKNCPNYILCCPRGLEPGDRYVIKEVNKSVSCPTGIKLVSVKAHRIKESSSNSILSSFLSCFSILILVFALVSLLFLLSVSVFSLFLILVLPFLLLVF